MATDLLPLEYELDRLSLAMVLAPQRTPIREDRPVGGVQLAGPLSLPRERAEMAQLRAKGAGLRASAWSAGHCPGRRCIRNGPRRQLPVEIYGGGAEGAPGALIAAVIHVAPAPIADALGKGFPQRRDLRIRETDRVIAAIDRL